MFSVQGEWARKGEDEEETGFYLPSSTFREDNTMLALASTYYNLCLTMSTDNTCNPTAKTSLLQSQLPIALSLNWSLPALAGPTQPPLLCPTSPPPSLAPPPTCTWPVTSYPRSPSVHHLPHGTMLTGQHVTAAPSPHRVCQQSAAVSVHGGDASQVVRSGPLCLRLLLLQSL